MTVGRETAAARGAVILPYNGARPTIAPDAFVAPTTAIIGDVTIGASSGVWFQCVLRGDERPIRIGARCNIQDSTVVHVSGRPGGQGTDIGDETSIGHMAVIHACTLEPGSFIGMGSIVLDNAVVESGAMVAAGSLVTPRTRVKSGELWSGRPARLWRPLTDDDRDRMQQTVKTYVERAREYLSALGAGR